MLRRIYEAQKAAYGPDDPRCAATRQKINTIRSQKTGQPPKKPVEDIVFEAGASASKDSEKNNGKNESTKAVSTQHAHNKVNSMFKAIKSFGRKK